jgi:uncharacterized protein (DUF1778 family)
MPMPRAQKSDRIDLRVSKEDRAILEQAALLRTGGDLSSLVRTVALDAARAIIRDHETGEVADDMRQEFYAALLRTDENPALKALFAQSAPAGYEVTP